MELEYQTVLRWIRQVVLKEKVPSNSKILWPLSGGVKSNKITLQSLASADQESEANKKFLEIVENNFGQDLSTRITQLFPLGYTVLSQLYGQKFDKLTQRGGSDEIELKHFALPIITIIIGYSLVDKLGEDKFNALVGVCVCYCIYLLVNSNGSSLNPNPDPISLDPNTIELEEVNVNSLSSLLVSNTNTKTNTNTNTKEKKLDIKYKKIYEYSDKNNSLYIDNANNLILNNKSIMNNISENNLFYDFTDRNLYIAKNIKNNQIEIFKREITGSSEKSIRKIKLGTTDFFQSFCLDNTKIYFIINEKIKYCKKKSNNDLILFNENKNYKQIYVIKSKLVTLTKEGEIIIYNELNKDTKFKINDKNIDRFEIFEFNENLYILLHIQNSQKIYKIDGKGGYKTEEININNLEKELEQILNFETINNQSGGVNSKPSDSFGLLSMVTNGIRWIVKNIKTYISQSIELTREWIRSPGKSVTSFFALLAKIATGSKSSLSPQILSSYTFNGSTGHIEYVGIPPAKIETIITPNIKFYIGYDYKLAKTQTEYFVNGEQMETISYIQSRPIATALVTAWFESEGKPSYKLTHPTQSKYQFEINPDGKIIVYDKATQVPIQSIQTSIDLWVGPNPNPSQAQAVATQVCKEMFGIGTGLANPTCSQYFYSVLGKSALSMMKIIGSQVEKSDDIKTLLTEANPGIKYEILKKLSWTMDSKRNLIPYDSWVKSQSQQTREYLETKPGQIVKSILKTYIQDVQAHLSQISEKNKESDEQKYKSRPINKSKRLTPSQVAMLRSDQIKKTSKLIDYGYPGLNLNLNQTQPIISGGADEFVTKYQKIKTELASFGKLVSSNTEKKIIELIDSINLLEQRGSGLLEYSENLIKLTKAFGKLEDYLY